MPDLTATLRFQLASLADARLELDASLVFDRAATRLLRQAEWRVSAALVAFAARVEKGETQSDTRRLSHEVEEATRARLIAAEYHA